MADQLTVHLKENALQDRCQSPYRKGYGTESALLKVKGDIGLALDVREGVLLVLPDLSAAFDTVDHNILIDRLKHRCGVTGTVRDWFRSYLSGRTQRVRIGEAHSKPTDLNIGVPQGPVMGPLLFSTYVRQVGDIARGHGVQFHGYADDTQMYMWFSPSGPDSLLNAIRTLERCIENIRNWMLANCLKINDDKTEFMVVVSRFYQPFVRRVGPTLRVGEALIRPKMRVRNLGVIFDAEGSVVSFVNQTVKTCYHHLKIISRIRRNLTSEACAAAVRALVLSRLDHANSLLVGVPKAVLQRLQVLQNNAARLIQDVSGRAHITPVLRDLHWLPIRQQIQHKLLSLTYRALNCAEAPKYLASALEWRRTTRQLGSSARQLVVPRTHRGAGDK